MDSGVSCGGTGGVWEAVVASALHFFAASQCLLEEPWPRHAVVANESSFDFIIVGGGTAGSALAARLAGIRRFNVLLVEAGPDPSQDAIIPAFKHSLIAGDLDWNFTTVNDGCSSQALMGGSQKQPRGKMLGGSGSLNDMVYARGFPVDYHEWATIAGPQWDWENVLPYFMKTEHMTDQRIINDEESMKYHGRGGEIEVSGSDSTTFAIDKFLGAFKEIGFNIVNDMTNPHQLGAGKYSHTIRDGRRDSTLTAMLNKADGDNIFVLKNTLATKIIFENGTAVGVKVLTQNEDELQFYAKKEVIISAGTFNTAKLLLLSGVGPKQHLEDLGIEVVKDLPVGDNLHDHVMFMNYIAAESGTCETGEGERHMDVIRYMHERSGTLARSDSMGALLALKDSDPNTPDFAFYLTCTPQNSRFYESCVSILGFGRKICEQLDAENQNYELLTVAVVLLKPRSRGKVRLRSADPTDEPLIYSGTFNNSEDLEKFHEAVDVVYSLAETTYFKGKSAHVVDIEIDVCNGLIDSDKIKCKAKAMASSAWHSVGTAAMGRVLDGELRVRGVPGVRVVDASVMPHVVRGNTNAPVVMIAEKAADFIKKAYGAE